MINDTFLLTEIIESLRKAMIRIGLQEGLNSEKAIKLSQKLDSYILNYQNLSK